MEMTVSNKKRTKIILLIITIVVVIISAIAIIMYFQINTVTKYHRMEMPAELVDFSNREVNDFDSFPDYMYQFAQVMLPTAEFHFHPLNGAEYSSFYCPEKSEGLCVVVSYIISRDDEFVGNARFNVFSDGVQLVNMTFFNDTSVASNDTKYVFSDGKYQQLEMSLQVCGDRADGEKCNVYYGLNDQKCYLRPVNEQFLSFNTFPETGYCPESTIFFTEAEQYIHYFFEGFLNLNIPYEFSWEYQRSQGDMQPIW